MIVGIGVDVCDAARLHALLSEQDGRAARFFSPEEQAYIDSRGQMAPDTMAGLFAAKEALVKALRTGFLHTRLHVIVVLHDEAGAPFYDLRGQYAAAAARLSVTRLHLSISHDGGMAAAFCIAERENP